MTFAPKPKIVSIVKGKQFTKMIILLVHSSNLELNPQYRKRIYVIKTLWECMSIPYLATQKEKITISITYNHITKTNNNNYVTCSLWAGVGLESLKNLKKEKNVTLYLITI